MKLCRQVTLVDEGIKAIIREGAERLKIDREVVDAFFHLLELHRRFPDATNTHLARKAIEETGVKRSLSTVIGWLDGRVPKDVKRVLSDGYPVPGEMLERFPYLLQFMPQRRRVREFHRQGYSPEIIQSRIQREMGVSISSEVIRSFVEADSRKVHAFFALLEARIEYPELPVWQLLKQVRRTARITSRLHKIMSLWLREECVSYEVRRALRAGHPVSRRVLEVFPYLKQFLPRCTQEDMISAHLLVHQLEFASELKMRVAAAERFGITSGPGAVVSLIRALMLDNDEAVRCAAAKSLLALNGTTSLDSVFRAHQEGLIRLKPELARILAGFEGRDSRVFGLLAGVLKSGQPSEVKAAILGLEEIGGIHTLDAIEKLLRSELSPGLRKRASNACEKLVAGLSKEDRVVWAYFRLLEYKLQGSSATDIELAQRVKAETGVEQGVERLACWLRDVVPVAVKRVIVGGYYVKPHLLEVFPQLLRFTPQGRRALELVEEGFSRESVQERVQKELKVSLSPKALKYMIDGPEGPDFGHPKVRAFFTLLGERVKYPRLTAHKLLRHVRENTDIPEEYSDMLPSWLRGLRIPLEVQRVLKAGYPVDEEILEKYPIFRRYSGGGFRHPTAPPVDCLPLIRFVLERGKDPEATPESIQLELSEARGVKLGSDTILKILEEGEARLKYDEKLVSAFFKLLELYRRSPDSPLKTLAGRVLKETGIKHRKEALVNWLKGRVPRDVRRALSDGYPVSPKILKTNPHLQQYLPGELCRARESCQEDTAVDAGRMRYDERVVEAFFTLVERHMESPDIPLKRLARKIREETGITQNMNTLVKWIKDEGAVPHDVRAALRGGYPVPERVLRRYPKLRQFIR